MEIEVASKPPLMADGCVPSWLKNGAYTAVREYFKPARALPSTIIGGFEAASNLTKQPSSIRREVQRRVDLKSPLI